MAPTAEFIELTDGRRLAWREYGDPSGRPCVYTSGTPSSGLAGAVHDEAARAGGVRWISPDKPGYGLSDFQPRRQLLDWPRDVVALADHLGIDRFAAAGESGGGPYALALAHAIPDRLTTTVVIAGMGPGTEDWVRKGMKRQNKVLFALAQHAAWALRPAISLMAWTLADERRAQRYANSQVKQAPPADRELFADSIFTSLLLAATRDAFRSGPRGATQEMVMFAKPWGFSLGEVRGHVDLWHGTDDVNVPVAVAQTVAAALPDCEAHILEGTGHLIARQYDEIMKVIASA